ncbi:hypothetical protein NLJ89_g8985 [Agrocybe chaxingu]|uniref:Uncharacterized protein n=1 Tax=Agrocybe chaxingu TaxID=84603 RepID=A0A9W8JTC5_9AGAR|nr:hypothetical protein NLJ89_g8985 [Agrocybe chaxingu]
MDYKTDTLSEIQKHLRGPDLVLKDVCDLLALSASLKMFYYSYEESTGCLLGHFAKFDDIDAYNIDEDVINWLVKHDKGEVVCDPNNKDFDVDNGEHSPVVWIKPLCQNNVLETPYIYVEGGYLGSMEFVEGEVCLVASVKPASERII